VLEWVRRESPASYLKVCAMLVPKEMRVEHSQSLKNMTDEELDAAIGAVRAIADERAKQGEMIDVTPKPEQGKHRAPRVHHAHCRRGGGMAARGACAAAGANAAHRRAPYLREIPFMVTYRPTRPED
jgi:diadenosine tetraphosphate (Ap4A) HIT family hydrolase